MVQINFALKEVNCKIVYYGPGMSGKTTNLEIVHQKAPTDRKGELTAIATEGDRTLFFDFLPLDLGKVSGMTTRFQLYTVPGQVYYNSTRKLVLQGADGVIFVADSAADKLAENLESLQNLADNLKDYGMDINTIPMVIQWNKRDLPNAMTVEELQEKVNHYAAPTYEAVATTGQGVFPTLKKLSALVLENLNNQQSRPRKRDSGAKPGPKPKPKAPTPPRPTPTGPPGGGGAKPPVGQTGRRPGPPTTRPSGGTGRRQAPGPVGRPSPGRPGQGRPGGQTRPGPGGRPGPRPGPRPPGGGGRQPASTSGRQPRGPRAIVPEPTSPKGLIIGVIVAIAVVAVAVVLYVMDMF